MDIVIIGHNEGKSIKNMLSSLNIQEGKIVYVADRCTDDTLQQLQNYPNVEVVDTTTMNFKGRKTSTLRNLGLQKCSENTDVLFLDGDRFVVEGDIRSLSSVREDIATIRLKNDHRNKKDFPNHYGTYFNWVYSCGLLVKRSAIKKITEKQNGKLFNEDLESEYGVEDVAFGDLCHHLGLSATLVESVKLNGQIENKITSKKAMKNRSEFNKKIGHPLPFMINNLLKNK